ncbi:hypothetical protein PsorP6_012243 [Peronosclerospora sorghi]|uniref:Uncharacterized protein n=1 Tax=Peronosclerospora sorghi TaxID=230839 RepID=A0ACC0WLA7_9STRA|nr:hypothetical protein PsorP6_012243 [Peronosclerospora sorghi]
MFCNPKSHFIPKLRKQLCPTSIAVVVFVLSVLYVVICHTVECKTHYIASKAWGVVCPVQNVSRLDFPLSPDQNVSRLDLPLGTDQNMDHRARYRHDYTGTSSSDCALSLCRMLGNQRGTSIRIHHGSASAHPAGSWTPWGARPLEKCNRTLPLSSAPAKCRAVRALSHQD